MKILDKIVISPTPPSSKNVAWFDGKSIKMPSQGEWKSTGGSGDGSGIEIVESVDKLDPNAPVGSLASVAVPGNITKTSVRDMQQPDTSILDLTTGIINTANLNIVTSVSIDLSKVSFDGKDTMVYFCTENPNFMLGGGNTIILAVMKQSQGEVQVQGGMSMNLATGEQKGYTFVQKAADGTITIQQDQIDEFLKQFEQNTFYYLGFFDYMTNGGEATEEDYISLDNIKVISGIPSIVNIYLKGDEWELLNSKDFDSLKSSIDKNTKTLDDKSDLIKIKNVSSSRPTLEPNTYYTCTISNGYQDSTPEFLLLFQEDTTKYVEHIIQINFKRQQDTIIKFLDYNTKQELPIVWANGIAPTFENGMTYLISISNGFGVYSMFPNS